MEKEKDEAQVRIATLKENILAVPLSKRDINRIAGGIINDLLSGERDVIEVEIKLRYLEELIKAVRGNEEVKEAVLGELEKYSEKTVLLHNAEITRCELGTKYDFSQCADSYYVALQDQIAELTDAKKRRETFLKSLDGEGVNPETGEVIYPPVKSSTSGIRVKLG